MKKKEWYEVRITGKPEEAERIQTEEEAKARAEELRARNEKVKVLRYTVEEL